MADKNDFLHFGSSYGSENLKAAQNPIFRIIPKIVLLF